MKIAYVYDAIYPYVRGGAEKRIGELATRLAARGHEIHLFGMKWWDGPDAVVVLEGVIIHGVCPAEPLYAGGRRTAGQALRFARSVYRPLLSLGRDSGLDLIDCQNFPYFPCFSAHQAAKQLGIPLAISWHEVWGEYWYEYLGRRGVFGKIIEARAAALPHYPIAVSPMTARALAGLGVSGKVPVIPNGIDMGQIAAVVPAGMEGGGPAACYGRGDGGPDIPQSDIIFTGRLIREKHVDLLIRAAALLREELPGLRLAIIGDGPERQALETLAQEEGIAEAVSFTGFLPTHDAVIAAMKASKVFVLPSTREGFGIVALEAMACGLPVVTVDHPRNAAADLVEDGVTGYRCPLSPEGLAEGIRLSLSEPEQMQDALRAVAAEYVWEGIVTQVEGRYEQMVIRD
ncbi:glycosyltransferase involved in cell wall biosynthesis [Methanocalculus sp. AMF5]|uniref:glycosyltransferase family 4 protein n=1 Tax=Methanocalculus sp. AMF5 TaxID=1198257 RepID=UPI0020A0A960|nr:glycosyltransferase family 4 protein [Methanocalculus sp. AMF5]MCP1662289.1 glycosyltransferase involved in cell wall biosynthesis [Methanocalculus sp. AMF5]